jgi:hypothetical protein
MMQGKSGGGTMNDRHADMSDARAARRPADAAAARRAAVLGRRSLLKLGVGGLAGGSFLDLVSLVRQSQAATPPAGGPQRQPANCILIWMDGGPSHIETFDPKPDAPSETRGEFAAIRTNVPGIQISEYLPKLAGIADKYAIVRSVHHNQGNHGAGNHYMMTGAPPRIPVGCGAYVSFHPSMGSVTAYERRAPYGLPAYFSMPSMTRSGGPNFLGATYAPFVVSDNPNGKEFRVRDLSLPRGLDEGRFLARRDLRKLVDRLPRIDDPAAADPVRVLDDYYDRGMTSSPRPRPSRPSRSSRRPTRPATPTAATSSASGCSSPGGWSRRACRSSRSTTPAGTTTSTSSASSASGSPPGTRPWRRSSPTSRSAGCSTRRW